MADSKTSMVLTNAVIDSLLINESALRTLPCLSAVDVVRISEKLQPLVKTIECSPCQANKIVKAVHGPSVDYSGIKSCLASAPASAQLNLLKILNVNTITINLPKGQSKSISFTSK
jgi:hypothetical protein